MIAEICTGYDVKSGTECRRDAIEDVTAACVHEHIGTRSLCEFHTSDLREGRMQCGDCGKSREPHACDLTPIPARRRTTR